MKVKLDFVTNSSSSCFLMAIPKDIKDDLQDYVTDLNEDVEAFNEGVQLYEVAETLKELQTYTNDGPLDWASKPGGPQFYNLSEEYYKKAKDALERGVVIIDVSVDYNVCERFEESWGRYILGDTT